MTTTLCTQTQLHRQAGVIVHGNPLCRVLYPVNVLISPPTKQQLAALSPLLTPYWKKKERKRRQPRDNPIQGRSRV